MANELKSCKCGKKPQRIERYSNGTRYFAYWCGDCNTALCYEESEKEAKRVWNRRATDGE